MFLKNSFGIPRPCTGRPLLAAPSHFCTRKGSEDLRDAPRTRPCGRIHPPRIFSLSFFSSLPRSLFLVCVFYCKLRLKSLARSQAFHLGRCIPADTRYMLAYVSRVSRAREGISITYTRREELLRAAYKILKYDSHVYV